MAEVLGKNYTAKSSTFTTDYLAVLKQKVETCVCEKIDKDGQRMGEKERMKCKEEGCLWNSEENRDCPKSCLCTNNKISTRQFRVDAIKTQEYAPPLGKGVKETKKIYENDLIIEYTGVIRSIKEYENESKQNKNSYMQIGKEHVVDAFPSGNDARFINTSCCKNNARAVEWIDRDGVPYIIIQAIEDIESGQQIFYDYQVNDVNGKEQMPCHCKLQGCKDPKKPAPKKNRIANRNKLV